MEAVSEFKEKLPVLKNTEKLWPRNRWKKPWTLLGVLIKRNSGMTSESGLFIASKNR